MMQAFVDVGHWYVWFCLEEFGTDIIWRLVFHHPVRHEDNRVWTLTSGSSAHQEALPQNWIAV